MTEQPSWSCTFSLSGWSKFLLFKLVQNFICSFRRNQDESFEINAQKCTISLAFFSTINKTYQIQKKLIHTDIAATSAR